MSGHTPALYGADAARVAVSGGSAGATNALGAGATFPGDYFDGDSLGRGSYACDNQPLTEFSRASSCGHWSSDGEILLPQQHDPANRSRYTADLTPPSSNSTVTWTRRSLIAHAYAVQAAYNKTGVPYELHVLEGCGHGSWCYNGMGIVVLAVRTAEMALPDMIRPWTRLHCEFWRGFSGYCMMFIGSLLAGLFLATHLNLTLLPEQRALST